MKRALGSRAARSIVPLKVAADHKPNHRVVRDLRPREAARVLSVLEADHPVGQFADLAQTVRNINDADAPLAVGWAPRSEPLGMMAISGETATDTAGTTSSSDRFSPLKMLPS